MNTIVLIVYIPLPADAEVACDVIHLASTRLGTCTLSVSFLGILIMCHIGNVG